MIYPDHRNEGTYHAQFHNIILTQLGFNEAYMTWYLNGQDFFYKISNEKFVYTARICKFNQKLVSDNTIGGRLCESCPETEPFSPGVDSTTCVDCDMAFSNINRNNLFAVHVFEKICPLD